MPIKNSRTLSNQNFSETTLSEEVEKRSLKPENDPASIPKQLDRGDFNTSITHFYRGEVARSNVWRTRLDATTNWAVITAAATLSFVFTSPSNPHFAIPINSILVSIFLFMEARRYRYYEVWAHRVRVLESGYFAPMLSHRTPPPDRKWAEHISNDLIKPHFTITEWEAVGRRLRNNYIWIFALLALSWGLKVYIHPFPAASLRTFVDRAQIGILPGWAVILMGIIFNLIIVVVAFATLKLNKASSEVKPHENMEWTPVLDVSRGIKKRKRARNLKKIRDEI